MKKFLGFLTIAILLAAAITSCKKDSSNDTQATAYKVKTISFYADWAGGTELWDFSYNATTRKVTKFVDYWEGAVDKTITYDYSKTDSLILMNGTSVFAKYLINAQGNIVKEDWGGGEYATWEYDANGYCISYHEFWSGVNHLKYQMEITNGNITKWTTYGDDGVTVTKIKEFFYSVGKNVNGLHQANSIDSDWKSIGNFYGKPCVNLLDHFDYWDPRVTPISKSTSTFTYAFDTKDRPVTATKTLTDMSTEVWNYTYYETAE